MEHRTTALCSLLGRQECLPYLRPVALMAGGCRLPLKAISKCRPYACTRRADPEEMEHRPYRPVLSTGQARMPTLPKARMPTLPKACR